MAKKQSIKKPPIKKLQRDADGNPTTPKEYYMDVNSRRRMENANARASGRHLYPPPSNTWWASKVSPQTRAKLSARAVQDADAAKGTPPRTGPGSGAGGQSARYNRLTGGLRKHGR